MAYIYQYYYYIYVYIYIYIYIYIFNMSQNDTCLRGFGVKEILSKYAVFMLILTAGATQWF